MHSLQHASKLVLDAHIKSGLGASSSVLTLYEFRRLLGSALGLERNENIADHDVSTILLKLTRNRQIVTEGIHIGPDGVWSTVGQGVSFSRLSQWLQNWDFRLNDVTPRLADHQVSKS